MPVAAFCLLLPAMGCRKQDDGLTNTQRQSGDRLSQIAKRTGGDWNKLTPEERRFLVTDLSYGNESSARMLLLAAAGKIGGKPGGPPRR